MVLQLETRLRESLERLRLKEQNTAAARNAVGNSNHLEVTLQQLLSTLQTHANRLAKLDGACFRSPAAGTGISPKTPSLLPEGGGAGSREQEVASRQVEPDGPPQVRVALAEVLRSWQQRNLPAGEISVSAAVCPHLPSLSSPPSAAPPT